MFTFSLMFVISLSLELTKKENFITCYVYDLYTKVVKVKFFFVIEAIKFFD